MATSCKDSDPTPAPVIVIDTAGGGPKLSRSWYARSAYCLPAMYLALIAALWFIAVVIPPVVELPITGMLAIILMLGPVGLCIPSSLLEHDAGIFLALICAGNCALLYWFGRFLDA